MGLWPAGHGGIIAVATAIVGMAGLQASRPVDQTSTLGLNAGTGIISGVVTDATTGQPVAGATVSLGRFRGPRALTDSKGRFVFRNVPAADNYYLDARRLGYASTRYGWTAPNGSLTLSGMRLVRVADGQWVNDIAIPLWRLGTIGGRVLDERGEPVVGVAVRAFSMANIAGAPQLVGGPIGATDDRGVYRLTGLMPGRYLVGVLSVQSTVPSSTPDATLTRPVGQLESGGIGGSKGSAANGPSIDVDGRHRLVLTNFATPPPPAATGSRAYQAQFHPGATTPAAATTIEIGYGDTRQGIDFQLEPVPSVRVSGRLQHSGGLTTFPPALLRLMAPGTERLGFGSETATTVVEPDGRFTFLNVPAGQYLLIAQRGVMDFTTGSNSSARLPDAPGFPAGGISIGSMSGAASVEFLSRSGADVPFWGRAPLSVGSSDVDDLVVAVRPVAEIRGRIVFEEGTKTPNGAFVFAYAANGDPSLGQAIARPTPKDQFAFTLTGLIGGQYLLTSDNAALRLVSVRFDGRDVTDAGFDAATATTFDGVVVTLTDKKAEIRGTVRTGAGPAPAAVIAFPVNRDRWVNFGLEPARFRTARSATNGEYLLSPLPAGDYFVIAVDLALIDAWADQKFLAAAAPLATRVSVKYGDVAVQNLSMTTVPVR
jgi:hypothetical protein